MTQRHNEIRDALGDLVVMGFNEVLRELVVRKSDNIMGMPALMADLSVRGVWQPQTAHCLMCVLLTLMPSLI